MEKFGSFLSKQLPELKEIVEDKLGEELGKISLRPLPEYIKEEGMKNLHQNLKDQDKSRYMIFFGRVIATLVLYFAEATDGIIAKCGKSTIYYSRSPLLVLRSNNKKTSYGLHELVHIAHMRMLEQKGYDDNLDVACIKGKIPKYIAEGFADYIVDDIMKDVNRGPSSDRATYGNPKYLIPFLDDIISKKIQKLEEVKEYVLTFH